MPLFDYKCPKCGAKMSKLVKVYDRLGMKFPKLEKDESVKDIDPFTVFGMFNKGITEANRISIIKLFAEEFKIDMSIGIPESFIGIPVLNNLKYYPMMNKN